MPALTRKPSRKIALKKASGAQILSGLKITKADIRHAEKALAAAKKITRYSSPQRDRPTGKPTEARRTDTRLNRAEKMVK